MVEGQSGFCIYNKHYKLDGCICIASKCVGHYTASKELSIPLSLFSTCVLRSIYSVEGEVKGQTENKVCDGCGTELMVKDDGSHFMFCHSCGKNCSENGKSLGRSNFHRHGSENTSFRHVFEY